MRPFSIFRLSACVAAILCLSMLVGMQSPAYALTDAEVAAKDAALAAITAAKSISDADARAAAVKSAIETAVNSNPNAEFVAQLVNEAVAANPDFATIIVTAALATKCTPDDANDALTCDSADVIYITTAATQACPACSDDIRTTIIAMFPQYELAIDDAVFYALGERDIDLPDNIYAPLSSSALDGPSDAHLRKNQGG